jgi:hypothetical protein
MHQNNCTDRVIGAILARWRYDISGIAPDMRKDYEQHLVECDHCRGRQRLHRTIDVTLAALTSASVVVFLLALSILHRIDPLQHWAFVDLHLRTMTIVLTLHAAAIAGLLFSLLAFLLVATMTPAPVYIGGMALAHTRGLHGRMSDEMEKQMKKSS